MCARVCVNYPAVETRHWIEKDAERDFGERHMLFYNALKYRDNKTLVVSLTTVV